MSFNGVRICTRFSTRGMYETRLFRFPSPPPLYVFFFLFSPRFRGIVSRVPSEIERDDREVRDRD